MLLVVAAPSLMMLAGSLVAFFGRVPDKVQAATQNFSAGLLISAVAGELYPLMNGTERPVGVDEASGVSSSDAASTFAIFVGFLVGLAFMYVLEIITGEEDDEEEKEEEEHDIEEQKPRKTSDGLDTPLLKGPEAEAALEAVREDARSLVEQVETLKIRLPTGNRDEIDEVVHSMEFVVDKAKHRLANKPPTLDAHNLSRLTFHVGELSEQCVSLSESESLSEASSAHEAIKGTLQHIHNHAHRVKFKRWQSVAKLPTEVELKEIIEWPLVFAVSVDAFVDGLLIGLALSASFGAGWSMSIATCIEMCFLGLSFSASIQNQTRSVAKHTVIVCVPPLILIIAGTIGYYVGDLLHQSPLVFIGFIAFSIVALLFLVTQEFLAEAREHAGGSKLINSMFFVGLFGGFVLSKYVG